MHPYHHHDPYQEFLQHRISLEHEKLDQPQGNNQDNNQTQQGYNSDTRSDTRSDNNNNGSDNNNSNNSNHISNNNKDKLGVENRRKKEHYRYKHVFATSSSSIASLKENKNTCPWRVSGKNETV